MWSKTSYNTQQIVGLSLKGMNAGVPLGHPKTNFNTTKGNNGAEKAIGALLQVRG